MNHKNIRLSDPVTRRHHRRMNRLAFSVVSATVLAAAVLVSAQEGSLPSEPRGLFGRSITGAYDGWFNGQDGTRFFLVGYFNRNLGQVLDIPIGPNNRIEPGGPDMGQPTHFLPGHQVGMFTVAVPRAFTPQQALVWTLVANGQTTHIPLRLSPDYYVSPFGGDVVGNRPPVIRFEERGSGLTGPIASTGRAITRTTSLATPLLLTIWADDDARYTSGTNAPMRNPPPPVSIAWSKYRGPGVVTFASAHPTLDVAKGGKVDQPFSGRGDTTATFSEAGEYILHATVNDYSGAGGGGEVCCWTTTLVKVTVTH
jgi:hypothetical protein